MRKLRPIEDSPNPLKIDSKEYLEIRVRHLEQELQELNDFKKIETSTQDDHNKLSMKLNYASDQNAMLELKVEVLEKKIQDLEKTVSNLESNDVLNTARAERQKALGEKRLAEETANSIEYELEQVKDRAKKREDELLKSLHAAWDESQTDIYLDKIKTLEEKLKKSEELISVMQSQIQEKATVLQPDLLSGKDLSVANNELQDQLNVSIQERAKLASLVEELRSSLDESASKVKELEDTIISRETEMTSVIAELKDELQRIMCVGEEHARLKIVEKEHKRLLNDLTLKLNDLQEMSEEAKAAKGLMQVHKQRIYELEVNEANNKKILEQLENELSLKTDDEMRLENEVQRLTDANEEMSRNAHYRELALDLEAQLYEARDELAQIQKQATDATGKTTSKLEDEVKELKAAAEIYVGELEVFKTKYEELQLQVATKEDRIEILEEELMQTRLQLKNEVEKGTLKLEDEVKELKAAPEISVEELLVFKAKYEELQFQAIAQEESIKNFEGEIEQAQKRSEGETGKETLKLEDELKDLKTAAEISAGELEVFKTKYEELQLQEAAKEDTVKNLKAQLYVTKDELEQTQKKLSEMAESSHENEQKQLKVVGELEAVMTKYEEFQLQSSEKEEHFKGLEAQLHATEYKLAQTQKLLTEQTEMESSSLENERKKSKIATEILTDELEKFKTKCEEIQLQVATKEERIKTLEEELVKIRKQFTDETGKATSKLEDQIMELKASFEISSGELEIFKAKYEELQLQVATKENSIQILESYIRDKNQELQELQTNMELISNDSNEVENLKKQLQDVEKERDDLKLSVAEADEFKATIPALETSMKKQSETYDKINKENVALKLQKEEMTEHCKTLQQNFTRIDAENTNLKSKFVLLDDEINTLQKQLKERTGELDEIKIRYRRRSSDNERKLQLLDLEKSELVQSVGAVEAEKATIQQELHKLTSDYNQICKEQVPQLRAENDCLKKASSEKDTSYAILDEKYSQMSEINRKLEVEVSELQKSSKPKFDSVIKANDRLERDIQSLKEEIAKKTNADTDNLQTIAELREERDGLLKLVETKKVSSLKTSPKVREKRASNDLYVSRNQQLLIEGAPTPTRSVERNVERKNRRQSVVDERRRLSNWERFTDAEVQTDAVNEICACSELSQKLKELQIELRKKDCKISNMERMAKHNPLKLDVEDLKKTLAREQRDHHQTKASLESMARNIHKLEAKIEALNMIRIPAKEMKHNSSQTKEENFVNKVSSYLEAIKRNAFIYVFHHFRSITICWKAR